MGASTTRLCFYACATFHDGAHQSREYMCVTRGREQRPIAKHLTKHGQVRRDHWNACGQCLQGRQTKTFIAGWKNKRDRSAIERTQPRVVDEAMKREPLADACSFGGCANASSVSRMRSRAHEPHA